MTESYLFKIFVFSASLNYSTLHNGFPLFNKRQTESINFSD